METNSYRHILVIGGTGMLREASIGLLEMADRVSVLARGSHSLIEENREINPIIADYNDLGKALPALSEAIQNFGPIDLAVSWIHATAPAAPFEIAKFLASKTSKIQFYEILGSAISNPAKPDLLKRRAEQFQSIPNVYYHSIVLGFIIEGKSGRWLSDSEISKGVLSAILLEKKISIVGTTEPWDLRS